MVEYYQAYNKRNNAWVKYKKDSNNKTTIVDIKQREPMKKFKGVKVKY